MALAQGDRPVQAKCLCCFADIHRKRNDYGVSKGKLLYLSTELTIGLYTLERVHHFKMNVRYSFCGCPDHINSKVLIHIIYWPL